MQGLEAPPEDGLDDALGIMRQTNEHNHPAYSEAEEVLAKQASGLPMPSPLSGYRLRPGSSRRGDDMKENRKSFVDIDGGASTFVNWLLVSHTEFLRNFFVLVKFVANLDKLICWGVAALPRSQHCWNPCPWSLSAGLKHRNGG